MSYAVEYDSLSTVNGKPVGTVFAQHCPHIGRDVWSYTKDSAEATHFPTREEAERVCSHHWWNAARVVEV